MASSAANDVVAATPEISSVHAVAAGLAPAWVKRRKVKAVASCAPATGSVTDTALAAYATWRATRWLIRTPPARNNRRWIRATADLERWSASSRPGTHAQCS